MSAGADDVDDSAMTQRVARWAKNIEHHLRSVAMLLDAVEDQRRELGPAEIRVVREMGQAIQEFRTGEVPFEMLELRASIQRTSDDARGTRVYSLRIDDEGIRADCSGSEWTRDIGSDSWTGAEFHFEPGKWRPSGEFSSFITEFEDVIRSAASKVEVLRNADLVDPLDEDGTKGSNR